MTACRAKVNHEGGKCARRLDHLGKCSLKRRPIKVRGRRQCLGCDENLTDTEWATDGMCSPCVKAREIRSGS